MRGIYASRGGVASVSGVLKTFIKTSRMSLNEGDKTSFLNIQVDSYLSYLDHRLTAFKVSLLEDGWFTVSRQVLLYNEVRQLHTHSPSFVDSRPIQSPE